MAFISGVTMIEPRMPVSTTTTAASAGMPPTVSVSAMAIGAVTDLAASEARISRGAPKSQAMPMALPMAERAGDQRGAHRQQAVRDRARLRQSGRPRATVAGPSRK